MTVNNREFSVLDILLAYDEMIKSRLNEFDSNYHGYTNEEASDKIKKIFDMITAKFRRQDELLKMLPEDESLRDEVNVYQRKKKDIKEMMFHMTQLHVDEPGFRKYMNVLAQKMKESAYHMKPA